MNLGDIKAAVGVVRALRDDWDRLAVQGQIEELAGNYDHPDVLYVCVEIARDPSNRAPVMLHHKAPGILDRLHARTASNPTPGPRNPDGRFLCDVCNEPEARCQSAATNLDGADHTFRNTARAQHERDQQHADGRIAAARANAIRRASEGLFRLPADVTEPPHPGQESEHE